MKITEQKSSFEVTNLSRRVLRVTEVSDRNPVGGEQKTKLKNRSPSRHSQGDTVDEARKNLQEALELFFETASPDEIKERMHEEVYVTHVKIAIG